MSELTVKSLAKKYGVSARDIIKELNNQGFDNISGVDDVIDPDSVELVESYFSDLYDRDEPEAPKGGRKSGGKGGKNRAEKEPPKDGVLTDVVCKSLAFFRKLALYAGYEDSVGHEKTLTCPRWKQSASR